ncbi:MAG: hypothetical protein HY904_02000 [Deltaproteobacteria bacterium]|nr:hypothetical protein [Deltaproteobacteria bacterium]
MTLTTEKADQLAKFGFTPDHRARMEEILKKIGTDRAEATDKRARSQSNTKTEREALSDVKALKRKLLSAADDLATDAVMNEDDRKALNAGRKLARSTTLHSAYLTKVRGVVERHSAALKPLMGGERDPLTWLDDVKKALDSAQSTQELSVASLPTETAEVYESKGELLTLIEKANRAGCRAYDGDARTIGLFNKDLILRAVANRAVAAPKPLPA